MSWKTVRLELAKTPEHPNGSPFRAYLLRLPVDAHGVIDSAAYRSSPHQARVRRFWPNEPDRSGAIVHDALGWRFVFRAEAHCPAGIFHLEAPSIALHEHVLIAAPDSEPLPFNVLRCE